MEYSSIFVNPEEKEQEAEQTSVPMPEPVPVPKPVERTEKMADLFDGTVTAEGIHEQILAKDEEGYSPCSITVHLEKIHNVTENTVLDDVKEEDREYIDSVQIRRCSMDIFSLREDLVSVNFVFDSPNDAYLQELNEMMHRYRVMSEEMSKEVTDGTASTVPVLTVSFMPLIMNGAGFASYQAPVDYCIALGDDGKSGLMHMLFDMNTILYSELEFTEEEVIETQKNIMQEDHSGLFEE